MDKTTSGLDIVSYIIAPLKNRRFYIAMREDESHFVVEPADNKERTDLWDGSWSSLRDAKRAISAWDRGERYVSS